MDAAKQRPAGARQNNFILVQRQQVLMYKPFANNPQKNLAKPNMSDAYINAKASQMAVEKHKESLANKVERGAFLVGLPVITSIADGALASSELVSTKVKATLNTGKRWGIAIATLFGAYKGIDYLTKNVPVLRNFREESPGLTTVGTVAGTAGAMWGANALVDKAGESLGKINLVNDKVVKPVKEQSVKLGKKLNNSKLGSVLDNGIFKPTQNFFQNNRAGKFIYKSGVPLIFGGVILKFVADLHSISRNKNKIAEQLREERNESWKILAEKNPFSEAQNS